MIIKHSILHLLNKDTGELIKSNSELLIEAGGVHEYLEKFIDKFKSSDFKEGEIGNNELLQKLTNLKDSELFVQQTGKFAEQLFNAIAVAEEVPSGDLLVIDYSEGSRDFLAIFKLNFTRMYSQSIDTSAAGITNSLVLNHNILQTSSQQISDGLVINKTDEVYWVTEKKYVIDGHRTSILSPLMGLEPKLSARTQMKYLRQAVKKAADKYDIPAYKPLSDVQNYLHENAMFVDSLPVENVAKETFPNNEAAQSELISNLNRHGVDGLVDIPVGSEKKLAKRVFKLDSGIELSVPAELLKDDKKIEFIVGNNGTTLLQIKDIQQVQTKFIN